MSDGFDLTLTAPDDHRFDVYENRAEGAVAAVVVVQEIFGVNDHIRSVVDRYAEAGYHALAPAVFDRVESKVSLGYDAEAMAAGGALAAKLDWDEVMVDIATTVEYASATGPVAVVGYCFGGSVAWAAAGTLPVAAAVGYYGGRIIQMIDQAPRAPVMLHFGALDAHIPLEGVNRVAERHPEVEVHIYDDAGHGFNCDARSAYHEASATLARRRTLEFLAANGVSPTPPAAG